MQPKPFTPAEYNAAVDAARLRAVALREAAMGRFWRSAGQRIRRFWKGPFRAIFQRRRVERLPQRPLTRRAGDVG